MATTKKTTGPQPYVIIRATNAGCFAGTLVHRDGQEVTLSDARRLWYWAGAASLSELAMKGTSRPTECMFPAAVPELTVLEVIEIIPTTSEARASIEAVRSWTAH